LPADEIIRPAIVEIVDDSEAIATVAEGFHQDQVVTQEQAYRIYCSTGARSLRKTADILRLPHGTVLSWNRRYHWQKKLRDTDLEVTEGLAQATAVLAVSRGIKALEVLSQIMEDGEVDPRARVSAASEVLKQFNGITALVAGSALTKGVDEDVSEQEMEELARTPEGVQKLIALQRERTGRGQSGLSS